MLGLEAYADSEMSEFELKAHCLKGGKCVDPQGEKLRRCPTQTGELKQYVDKSPLALAERLCLDGLRNYGESRSKDPFKDLFHSISYDLDRAIAMPMTSGTGAKETLLFGVIKMMHQAQAEQDIFSKSRLPYHLRLKRLGIFMPAFRARIGGEQLNDDAMLQVHTGLTMHLSSYDDKFLRRLPKNAYNEKKMVVAERTELEVMGLLTRKRDQNYFPYPSLKREEASHARSEYNHDIYTIAEGQKVPAQIKTSANGNGYRDLVVIRHHDILLAMKREPEEHVSNWEPPQHHEDFEWPSPYQYRQIIAGSKPSPISQLLVEEMEQGRYFDQDKRSALNLASSYVISRLDEYSRNHLA